MIKKYKSKLLGILSISMLSIIPVVIASCSTTTNSNTSSSEEKPNKPTNPSIPSEKPNDPSLKGDETNNDNFAPSTSNGIYSKIINKLNSYFPWEINNIVYEEVRNHSIINSDDIKDIIKMWSFNKWFSSKNKSKINPIQSNIGNINLSRNSNSNWGISFDYSFKIIIKDDSKEIPVYVKKHFELSNGSLGSQLSFNTKTIEIKVNGYNALTIDNDKINGLNNDTVKRILQFAKSENSNWIISDVFIEFLRNKNIVGKLGIWNNAIKIEKGVSINEKRDLIDVDLNMFDNNTNWYEIRKTSTLENIKNIIINNNTLNQTFINLISDDKKLIKNYTVQTITENYNSTKFRIMLQKENKTISVLEINFKNYK